MRKDTAMWTNFWKIVFALLIIAALNACAPAIQATTIPTLTATLTPTLTPTPKPALPPTGVDLGIPGDPYSLPESVKAQLNAWGYARVVVEQGNISGGISNGTCAVAMPEHLVTGGLIDGPDNIAQYKFADGSVDQQGFWKNFPVPEGWQCTAAVAKEGNKHGFIPRTVVIFWFNPESGEVLETPLPNMWENGNQGEMIISPDGKQVKVVIKSPAGDILAEHQVDFSALGPDLSTLPDNVKADLANVQWSAATDDQGRTVLVDADNNKLWREADGSWQKAETVTIGGEPVQAWQIAESATAWEGEISKTAITIQEKDSKYVDGYRGILATFGGATVKEWTVFEADSGLTFADVVFVYKDDRTGAVNTLLVRYSEETAKYYKEDYKQVNGNFMNFVNQMLQPGSKRIVHMQFQAEGSTVTLNALTQYSLEGGSCSTVLGCQLKTAHLGKKSTKTEIIDLFQKSQSEVIDLRDISFTALIE
ncbi:MAG: hypothetical protein ACOYY3_20730 [Chloroflexota bacterium]